MSLHDKYLSLSNDNHLYYVASEHTGGQLGRKEKAAFSIEYQLFLGGGSGLRAMAV